MSRKRTRDFISLEAPIKKHAGIIVEQRARTERNRIAALERLKSRGYNRTSLGWIRSLPNSGETKYNDCAINDLPISNMGSIIGLTALSPTPANHVNPYGSSLNLISQGTGKNQRIGNKLDLYQIRAKGQLVLVSNAKVDDLVRILLVRDKQANGSTPAISDILEQSSNSAGTGLTINSYRNMDNIDRFDVLKDKTYKLQQSATITDNSGTTTGGFQLYVPFKLSHKLRTHQEICYSSTTGSIGEIKSTNYMLVFISTEANATAVNGTTRVYWKDK